MTLVLTDLPQATQEAVAATRERVAALHAELPRNGLVVWTAGNVSERVPATDPEVPGLLVIKPSGVSYDELTAESMVVCTLDGTKIVRRDPRFAHPLLGHRGPRLRVRAHGRGGRRGPHPLDLCDRLGRPRPGDPLRADDDGR